MEDLEMLDDGKRAAKMEVLRSISKMMDQLMADGLKGGEPEAQLEVKVEAENEEVPADVVAGGSEESEDPELLNKLREMYEKLG